MDMEKQYQEVDKVDLFYILIVCTIVKDKVRRCQFCCMHAQRMLDATAITLRLPCASAACGATNRGRVILLH